MYGANSRRDTPVPISNTEVKSPSGDGTSLETDWESSTVPDRRRIFLLLNIILGSSMVEHSAVNR